MSLIRLYRLMLGNLGLDDVSQVLHRIASERMISTDAKGLIRLEECSHRQQGGLCTLPMSRNGGQPVCLQAQRTLICGYVAYLIIYAPQTDSETHQRIIHEFDMLGIKITPQVRRLVNILREKRHDVAHPRAGKAADVLEKVLRDLRKRYLKNLKETF